MNTTKDYLRKRKFRQFLNWKSQDDMESFFESLSSGNNPEREIELKELKQKMSQIIKKLPFKQQWIFTLRYLKGFTIDQISEVTELSEGTVKSTIHFAVKKFKKEIFPYLKEGGLSR